MIKYLMGVQFRLITAVIFCISISLLIYGYWLEIVRHLDPCPLCIFQRLAFMMIALVSLVGFLHNPATIGRRVYSVLGCICALVGALIAGRHVWLQSLPADKVPECGPGLDYLLETFPLSDVLRKVVTGSGECATVDWSFMGASMPTWALMWLLFIAAVYMLVLLRR